MSTRSTRPKRFSPRERASCSFGIRGTSTGSTYAKAQQIASLCDQADVLLVINDRVDVAMLLNAAVHVGQDDLPPSDARRLAGNCTNSWVLHAQRKAAHGCRQRADRLCRPRPDLRYAIQAKPRSAGRRRGTAKIETIGPSSLGCDRWHYESHRAGGLGCRGRLDRCGR